MASNGRMIRWWWIGKYLEGNGRGLVEVLSHNYLRETKKNHENPNQDALCLDWDSSRWPLNASSRLYRYASLPSSVVTVVTIPRIDISTKWDKPIKFWAFRRHSSGRNCALRPCCFHVTSMPFWVVGPLPWPIYIYFSLSLGWSGPLLALLLYIAQSCKH